MPDYDGSVWDHHGLCWRPETHRHPDCTIERSCSDWDHTTLKNELGRSPDGKLPPYILHTVALSSALKVHGSPVLTAPSRESSWKRIHKWVIYIDKSLPSVWPKTWARCSAWMNLPQSLLVPFRTVLRPKIVTTWTRHCRTQVLRSRNWQCSDSWRKHWETSWSHRNHNWVNGREVCGEDFTTQ